MVLHQVYSGWPVGNLVQFRRHYIWSTNFGKLPFQWLQTNFRTKVRTSFALSDSKVIIMIDNLFCLCFRYNYEAMYDSIATFDTQFGSRDNYETTNVIFTNGLFDRWYPHALTSLIHNDHSLVINIPGKCYYIS